MKIYGIKNCDTVRKALKWLDAEGLTYQFIDLRQEPVSAETLTHWCEQHGWQNVLNKRSTSWRNLSDAEKQVTTDADACTLMQKHPTLIKRPVLVTGDTLLSGFKADQYQKILLST